MHRQPKWRALELPRYSIGSDRWCRNRHEWQLLRTSVLVIPDYLAYKTLALYIKPGFSENFECTGSGFATKPCTLEKILHFPCDCYKSRCIYYVAFEFSSSTPHVPYHPPNLHIPIIRFWSSPSMWAEMAWKYKVVLRTGLPNNCEHL